MSELSHQYLDDLNQLPLTKHFLTREFLLWLWYQADVTQKFKITLPRQKKQRTIEIWIDDRILLESVNSKGHESLMRGGDPSHSHEATTSLKSGKTVKELKLGLRLSNIGDFTCILNRNNLTPKSLTIPDATKNDAYEDDKRSLIEIRLDLAQTFTDCLDGLFLMFIKERSDPKWDTKQLKDIQQWIKSRRH